MRSFVHPAALSALATVALVVASSSGAAAQADAGVPPPVVDAGAPAPEPDGGAVPRPPEEARDGTDGATPPSADPPGAVGGEAGGGGGQEDEPASGGADPAGTDAASTDPASTDPASTDPAGTDPASTDPASADRASPPPSPYDHAPARQDEPVGEPRGASGERAASGEDEAGDEALGEGEAEAEEREPTIEPRPIPDYDNRPEAGPSAEEALLWVPRVLFFPVHLVFEYVLRRPIGWLVTAMERERWHVFLIDFFTWEERQAGLVPTAFFDFGFQPSVGLYFWWNDFLFEGNYFRTQVAFGGVDWLRATVSDRVQASEETELSFTVDAWRRPDRVFQGIGWNTSQSRRSRYFRNFVEGRFQFRFRPWRQSEIRFTAGLIWNDFQPGGYSFGSDDPALGNAVMQGWYDLPPGFEGYTAYYQRLDVHIDTREPRPAPGHGVRLEGFVDQGFDVEEVLERRWIRYGGAVGGFVDAGNNRTFGLWGMARFADPLGTSQPVPFLEQVRLGGDPLVMSAFLDSQLIGRSAVVTTLEYRYPIWVFLDGSLHFSVGNVFGEHLSDFAFERLRMSFGLGMRSIGDRDQTFNVLLALGSAPFERGASIESVRVVVGSRQGF